MSPESSRLMQDQSAEGSRWSEGLSSSASRKRRGWVAGLRRPGGAFGQLEYPTPPLRVGEQRRREAVDRGTTLTFDRHGHRISRQATALSDLEPPPYAI